MTFEGDDFASREFRRGVWHRTATTVAMLTTAWDGRENVMACEWAMMVSASPLRFIVAVAPHCASHDMLAQSREFGLSFCSDAQARLSHVSGSYSMHHVDKWELADFRTYAATKIRAPMIDECPLNVECRLVATHALGDHTLFVGEAVWAKYDAERQPLIYHGGRYWQLGSQIPKE